MPGVDDFVTILTTGGAAITDTSGNPFLSNLVGSVNHCVTLYRTNGAVSAKAMALDDIMIKAAFWLTSKKPRLVAKGGKATTKNPARWDAMTMLAGRVAEESSKLGVKLLHSPTDFRLIKSDPRLGAQSYWLERVDQHHRPGYMLSMHYETWLGTPVNDTFWAYVDTQMSPFSYLTPMVLFYGGASAQLLPYQVTKNNADGLVYINSSVDVFDTENNQTAASGYGFAIFVCDNFDMFSASHVLGRFHHSTFFAGMPVTAAGEIVAKDGYIKLITAKSGHYRPSWSDMHRMVKALNWIPGAALIIPDFSSTGKYTRCYRVRDFRVTGVKSFLITKKQFNKEMPDFLTGNAAITHIVNKLPETDVGVWGTQL